jgi:hypothetical protein
MGSMIRSMSLGVFLVMLAFPLAMSAIVIVAGVTARRRAALVKSTPAAYIATAADGFGQFEGRAEAIERQTLEAPLTKAPCVWYHAKVEYLKRQGKSDESFWTTISDVTSEAPFLIRDDGGCCAVHPFGAEVTPTDKSLWHGTAPTPDDRNPPRVKPTENPASLMQFTGASRRYRYFEERIYDGDPLLVLGYFTRDAYHDEDEGEERIEFDATTSADEQHEDEPATDPADDAAAELTERLFERAVHLTKSVISRGTGSKPFVMTTTPKAMHIELSEQGGLAAIGIALFPLGIAALLVWTRYG